MQIGIDIHKGEIAQLQLAGLVFLDGKLVEQETEVGGFVLGEPSGRGAQFNTQYTGDIELQIEIGENI